MPVISDSSYKAPPLFSNGHVQTLYPYLFRKVKDIDYRRVRINTNDNDFIDLDFSEVGSNKLLILSHGLEGSSNSPYVKGMARHFNMLGVDALAWNMRSCSGEMNLASRFYHGGDSEELHSIIEYALTLEKYDEIYLMGFSLGANLTAKYLGDMGEALNPKIKKSVIFSAPCDLKSSAEVLAKPVQKIYLNDFMTTMKRKIQQKHDLIGLDHIDLTKLNEVKSFFDFDTYFTAPLHNFENAFDYYEKASCIHVLHRIKIPILIINAKNDPFLGKECYPMQVAQKNKNICLEIPHSGGHVGFVSFNSDQFYWSEMRASSFILEKAHQLVDEKSA
ncbi:hydrolase, alpha/beta domain protein [Bacteriovorax sp. BSW11_IV]|uniref:YheT family hydrolase n=1 Tax=Bacteriovorax sp. BSW11_IV TaxID=1353529 RepID=UPI000389FE79|nr:alpha/beta fold hydrolase [Bacteriovorax sp. BSW11_IV]EQC49536.1 hydrolase, alpha/beta domain protein [Bacteriovorax sp. BSW11_IV]